MLILNLDQDVSDNQGVRYVMDSTNPITLREFIKEVLENDLSCLLRTLGYYPEDLQQYEWVILGEEAYEAKKLARGEYTPISV